MWEFFAIFLALLVLSYVMAPKPQTQPPPGVGEVDYPTAEEGREMPVVFGCIFLRGPNTVWYGDLNTEPIKLSANKK